MTTWGLLNKRNNIELVDDLLMTSETTHGIADVAAPGDASIEGCNRNTSQCSTYNALGHVHYGKYSNMLINPKL